MAMNGVGCLDCGLRSKKIASVEWKMMLDAQSQLTDAIRLEDRLAKGKSGVRKTYRRVRFRRFSPFQSC
jgi:hypothetical protein